jgi:hypothetical protein
VIAEPTYARLEELLQVSPLLAAAQSQAPCSLAHPALDAPNRWLTGCCMVQGLDYAFPGCSVVGGLTSSGSQGAQRAIFAWSEAWVSERVRRARHRRPLWILLPAPTFHA